MRNDKAIKEKEVHDKKKKDKPAEGSGITTLLVPETIAELVALKLKGELQSLNNRLRDLEAALILQGEKITVALKSLEASVLANSSHSGPCTQDAPVMEDFTRERCDSERSNIHPSTANPPPPVMTDPDNHPLCTVTGSTVHPQPFSSRTFQQPPPSFKPILKAPSLAISNEEFIQNLTQSINAQASEPSRFSGSFTVIPNSCPLSLAPPTVSTLPVSSLPVPEDNYLSHVDEFNSSTVLGGNNKAIELLLSVSPTFSLGLIQEDQMADHEPDYLKDPFVDDQVHLPTG
ncbi:uncharacterized protein LOC112090231 [Eutrema salsugineum]|uniref:uncharacterized protein LOC112090231 n=1 Tax=Eutrema salsugineum TaxID=72664 RepID=UPI000CED4FF2|nr:uncharacterized protein LOC112090231 [Eutrema salsugineum]XP_024016805.1 uncharacterized protein LOC112090231 [Eutrema salsugineum]XP_024016806.1 uncharacterized protein LOC112090231 [Eutrema salsugineum]